MERTLKILSYIIAIIVFGLGIIFAYINAETVTFHYYIGQRDLPLSLLLVLALLFGALLGISVSGWVYLKQKKQNWRLKRQLRHAEKQLAESQNL